MASLRSVLRRNRGLAVALGVVSVVPIGYASLPAPGPRVSWSQYFKPFAAERLENLGVSGHLWQMDTPVEDDSGEFLTSPDGRSLLTIFQDQARVRDVATGRLSELRLNEPRSRYRFRMEDMDFLAGGKLLVGLLRDPDQSDGSPVALKVYEIPSGRERIAFADIDADSVWSQFSTSRDGSTLAYAMGEPGPPTVGVWNALEDRPPVYFAGKAPLALSDDGRVLALIEPLGSEAKLVVWEVATTRRLASIPVDGAFKPGKIAFSPDGRTLANFRSDEFVHEMTIVEVATSSIKHVLETDLEVGDPRFSPDGSLLFLDMVGCGGFRGIEVWDLAVNPPGRVFRGEYQDLSRDGHRMVQAGPDESEQPNNAYDPAAFHCRFVGLPSLKPSGRDLPSQPEHTAQHIRLKPEGRLAAMLVCHVVPTWSQMLSGWLPPGLRPAPPGFMARQLRSEARVIDPESGACLRTVNSSGEIGFVEDGKTLALRRWGRSKDPTAPGYDEVVELWDVPGPSSKWPILGGLAALALFAGIWSDVQARRRVVSASLST